MNRDHPLFGASATVFPIAGEALTPLKKKRHLQRLVAVCEGSRYPADVGFDERPRGLDLQVPWADMEAWLETVFRRGARWSPILLDRYLRKVSRKKGPAGYWTAHEAVFTMGEACRIVCDLLDDLGLEMPAPPRCKPVPYESRGNQEFARDHLYNPTIMENAAIAIRGSKYDSPAGRETLILLATRSAMMAPLTTDTPGDPVGFLLLPRAVDASASPCA